MGAQEQINPNLNPQQFYHASPHQFESGQQIKPRGEKGDRYAFFSSDEDTARSIADRWSDWGANVYRVTPTGPYERDPVDFDMPHYRSRHPLVVEEDVT